MPCEEINQNLFLFNKPPTVKVCIPRNLFVFFHLSQGAHIGQVFCKLFGLVGDNACAHLLGVLWGGK